MNQWDRCRRDLVVGLEPLGTTPWDGRVDANIDFEAVFASGRRVSFTAITPQNIITLWQTSYPELNGKGVVLDVPPRIVDGRTFLPLRFTVEALGETSTSLPCLPQVGVFPSTPLLRRTS